MSNLETAIRSLYELDTNQTPVELGRLRENALIDGIKALAAEFGKEIEPTHIDGRGDMAFTTKGASAGRGEQYGAELAAMISRVPHRTGLAATDAALLPENNWCWINHFEVERLLKLVGEDLFGITKETMSPASGPAV